MNRNKSKGLSALVCGLALLGLAACGGGGGGGNPAPTPKQETRVMPTPTPTPSRDRYGSIAYGDNYAGAMRSGDSRSSARNSALAGCSENGGTNCREVLWFRNACGAAAKSADGNRAGVAWASSKDDAHTKAIAACHASGGQNCTVVTGASGGTFSQCYTGGPSPATGQASTIDPRDSSAPAPGSTRRIQDVSTTIPSSCPVEAEVCVRDHSAEDGDRVRVSVNGNVAFSGEIFSRWQCRVVPVRSGQNQVNFLALNTGSSGPNTGSLRITGRGDSAGRVQQWSHDANAGSEARLLVTIGPAGGSCSVPGPGGTPTPSPNPGTSDPGSGQEQYVAGAWGATMASLGGGRVRHEYGIGIASRSSADAAVQSARTTCAAASPLLTFGDCSSVTTARANGCVAAAISGCNGCLSPAFGLVVGASRAPTEAAAIAQCEAKVAAALDGGITSIPRGSCRIATDIISGSSLTKCVGTAR